MRVLALAVAGLVCALPLPAQAQMQPVLSGLWTTDDRTEVFWFEDVRCSFQGPGLFVTGVCTWDGHGPDGVLTLIENTVTGPQNVYLQVHWVDATTFTIMGDVYHRRE